MVATPGDPGNGKYIRDLNTPIPVEIAYGGTCTAGKNEDMDMYAASSRRCAERREASSRVSPVLHPVRLAGNARLLRAP